MRLLKVAEVTCLKSSYFLGRTASKRAVPEFSRARRSSSWCRKVRMLCSGPSTCIQGCGDVAVLRKRREDFRELFVLVP